MIKTVAWERLKDKNVPVVSMLELLNRVFQLESEQENLKSC